MMQRSMKLYTWFVGLGFLLGVFSSVYSQLHAAQLQSEAGSATQTFVSPDGNGGVLNAIIFGILGMICGLAGAFLTRLFLSFYK